MSATAEAWYWEQRWSSFRRGSEVIRIRWDGGSALGTLYNDGVPQTVAAVAARLPLTVPVVHVAWSGDMVMSADQYDLGVTVPENDVRLVRPGDLSWDPKFGELAFTYGTAECRLPSGPNTVTVYGHVHDRLEELARYCRARRFEGAGSLILERPAS